MTREQKIKMLNIYCGSSGLKCEREKCKAFMPPRTNTDLCCELFENRTDEELDTALKNIGAVGAAEAAENEKPEAVNHPNHYQLPGGVECLDVMISLFGREFVQNWCVGNAFKYLFRHPAKNGREDLAKARWYLNKYFELEEG